MELKKVGVAFLLVVFLLGSVSAFGIRPAKIELDFIPNVELEFDFTPIFDPGSLLANISIGGDLEDYFELPKEIIRNGESARVNLKFPSEIAKPGYYRTYVYATEIKEGIGSSTIGSQVRVGALIVVFVPFKGQYVDAKLEIPNANVNEKLNVKLNLENLGTETASVFSKVLIKDSSNALIESITFPETVIESLKETELSVGLYTEDWKPGTYTAETDLVYSGPVNNINQTFSVGSLFVNVTNYTKEVKKNNIQKFYIDVLNGWNGDLGEVYANVNFTGEGGEVVFRTPSVNLKAWDSATLEGFVDTTSLDLGDYEISMELNYAGDKSYHLGTVKIIKNNSYLLIVLVIVLIIGVVGFVYWRKKHANSGKKIEG